jgi:hypothetical protein
LGKTLGGLQLDQPAANGLPFGQMMEKTLVFTIGLDLLSIKAMLLDSAKTFMKVVEHIHGGQDRVNGRLTAFCFLLLQGDDVGQRLTKPGNKFSQFTESNRYPVKLRLLKIVPIQAEMVRISPDRMRGSFDILQVGKIVLDRANGKVIIAYDEPGDSILFRKLYALHFHPTTTFHILYVLECLLLNSIQRR